MEFAEDLKYQLCRMFLVNAGTNKSMPSNRFTMEDPRGGALVTGPNGVGKTMTLRLLPLFFGFPPNRLRGWPVLAAGCRHSPPGIGAVVLFVPLENMHSASPVEIQADMGLPWCGPNGEPFWFAENG